MRSFGVACTVLGLVIAGFAGCGGGDEGPEKFAGTGLVTYKDQPVAGATVDFRPKEAGGAMATAVTDDEGKFEISAAKGKYAVDIYKFPKPESNPDATAMMQGSKEGMQADPSKISSGGGKQGGAPPMGGMAGAGNAKNELPEKYKGKDALEAEVVEDESKNDWEFKLTD